MGVRRSVQASVIALAVIFLLFAATGSPLAAAAEMPATQNPSTTHLTFVPPCPLVDDTVTLTAKVLGLASGTGILPTGTVTFTQGSTQLGTAPLDKTSGTATFPTSFSAAGQYPITASYGGDQNYLPSSDTETLQVGTACLQSTTTSLLINPNPAQVGETVTFTARVSAGNGLVGMITGTVDFLQDGTQIGTGTLDSTNTATFTTNYANTGTFTMTAKYEGDNKQFLGSTSSPVTLTIVPVGTLTPTTTTLSSSNSHSNFGDTVIFTATVQGGMGSGPTGTVTFLDGSSTMGTGTLVSGPSSSSKATFSTSGLSVGTHSITAQYGGDTNFSGSTSLPLSQVINNSTSTMFVISINPTTITVNQGNSGSANVTLTPSGGFNQTVTFLCSGLPIYSQCTFNPPTITPDGTNTPSNVVMTVSTNVATARLLRPNFGRSGAVLAVFSIGLLGLVQVRGRRQGRRSTLGRYASWLSLMLCIAVVTLLASCGGSSSNNRVLTPKGTSTVTVAGSTSTGAQTTTFTLTVQ